MSIEFAEMPHLSITGTDGAADLFDILRMEGVNSELYLAVLTDRTSATVQLGQARLPGNGRASQRLMSMLAKYLEATIPTDFLGSLENRNSWNDAFAVRDDITQVPEDLVDKTVILRQSATLPIDVLIEGSKSELVVTALLPDGSKLPWSDPRVTALLHSDDFASSLAERCLAIYGKINALLEAASFEARAIRLSFGLIGVPVGEGAQGSRPPRLVIRSLSLVPENLLLRKVTDPDGLWVSGFGARLIDSGIDTGNVRMESESLSEAIDQICEAVRVHLQTL